MSRHAWHLWIHREALGGSYSSAATVLGQPLQPCKNCGHKHFPWQKTPQLILGLAMFCQWCPIDPLSLWPLEFLLDLSGAIWSGSGSLVDQFLRQKRWKMWKRWSCSLASKPDARCSLEITLMSRLTRRSWLACWKPPYGHRFMDPELLGVLWFLEWMRCVRCNGSPCPSMMRIGKQRAGLAANMGRKMNIGNGGEGPKRRFMAGGVLCFTWLPSLWGGKLTLKNACRNGRRPRQLPVPCRICIFKQLLFQVLHVIGVPGMLQLVTAPKWKHIWVWSTRTSA